MRVFSFFSDIVVLLRIKCNLKYLVGEPVNNTQFRLEANEYTLVNGRLMSSRGAFLYSFYRWKVFAFRTNSSKRRINEIESWRRCVRIDEFLLSSESIECCSIFCVSLIYVCTLSLLLEERFNEGNKCYTDCWFSLKRFAPHAYERGVSKTSWTA